MDQNLSLTLTALARGHLVSFSLGILALILACTIRSRPGKGCLILSTALGLLYRTSSIVYELIGRLDRHRFSSVDPGWPVALGEIGQFAFVISLVCFLLFLVQLWSHERVTVSLTNLLFSFSGRIPRSLFWICLCIFWPIGVYLGLHAANISAGTRHIGTTTYQVRATPVFWVLFFVSALTNTWISLAVYAKRWHDCGKSGWMTSVTLIPVVGFFWFFGVLGFSKGNQGTNNYGDDPRLPPV